MSSLGLVKWFDSDKGYGFIKPENGEPEVFAHHSEIRSEGFHSLQENQRVRYSLESGPQGISAHDIEVV